MTISKGLTQAYQVQDFAYAAIQAFKAQCTNEQGILKLTRDDALALGHLHRMWQGAQERVSFHRRVPGPGVLKPVQPDKHKARKPTAPLRLAKPTPEVHPPDCTCPQCTAHKESL